MRTSRRRSRRHSQTHPAEEEEGVGSRCWAMWCGVSLTPTTAVCSTRCVCPLCATEPFCPQPEDPTGRAGHCGLDSQGGHRGAAVATQPLCSASPSRGGLPGLAGVTTRPAGYSSGGVPPAVERQLHLHHTPSRVPQRWGTTSCREAAPLCLPCHASAGGVRDGAGPRCGATAEGGHCAHGGWTNTRPPI
jgi:hypothetical protein